MDVDAAVERFGGFEDRPELGIVEIFVVGVAVDHEAVQAELVDRALHLLGGALGAVRREAGEAGEARRIFLAESGEDVVGEDRQLHRGVGVEHLHAGRGEREQVHVDAQLVHLPEATSSAIRN